MPTNPEGRRPPLDSDGSDGSEVTPFGATLDRFLRHLGAPGADTLSQLGDRWSEVVGPGLAEHTKPADFVNGVLSVICTDGAWASQIRWQDAQIKERFAQVFGGAEVRRLRVKIRPAAADF